MTKTSHSDTLFHGIRPGTPPEEMRDVDLEFLIAQMERHDQVRMYMLRQGTATPKGEREELYLSYCRVLAERRNAGVEMSSEGHFFPPV